MTLWVDVQVTDTEGATLMDGLTVMDAHLTCRIQKIL